MLNPVKILFIVLKPFDTQDSADFECSNAKTGDNLQIVNRSFALDGVAIQRGRFRYAASAFSVFLRSDGPAHSRFSQPCAG
jgi:hypothetical protein